MRSTQRSGVRVPTRLLGLFAAVLALAQPAVAQDQAAAALDDGVGEARIARDGFGPGMALARHAPNRQAAIRLMEFLVGDKAQAMYAEQNFEYPVKAGVPWSKMLESWGRFSADSLSLETVAELRPAAVKLVNEVGYNE